MTQKLSVFDAAFGEFEFSTDHMQRFSVRSRDERRARFLFELVLIRFGFAVSDGCVQNSVKFADNEPRTRDFDSNSRLTASAMPRKIFISPFRTFYLGPCWPDGVLSPSGYAFPVKKLSIRCTVSAWVTTAHLRPHPCADALAPTIVP